MFSIPKSLRSKLTINTSTSLWFCFICIIAINLIVLYQFKANAQSFSTRINVVLKPGEKLVGFQYIPGINTDKAWMLVTPMEDDYEPKQYEYKSIEGNSCVYAIKEIKK